jgi:hypothetical protein
VTRSPTRQRLQVGPATRKRLACPRKPGVEYESVQELHATAAGSAAACADSRAVGGSEPASHWGLKPTVSLSRLRVTGDSNRLFRFHDSESLGAQLFRLHELRGKFALVYRNVGIDGHDDSLARKRKFSRPVSPSLCLSLTPAQSASLTHSVSLTLSFLSVLSPAGENKIQTETRTQIDGHE